MDLSMFMKICVVEDSIYVHEDKGGVAKRDMEIIISYMVFLFNHFHALYEGGL